MSRHSHRGGGPPDSGVLSERVDGLQSDFASFRSEVGAALKALSDKFDERSRTPWGHIWSAAAVLLTVLSLLGGVGIYAVNQPQTQLAESLKQTQRDMAEGFRAFAERGVTEKELGAVIANASARRDDAQRQTEDRFRRDEADIDGLQKTIVPRGEHERQWADQRRFDDAQSLEIREVRRRLESDYMPKEALEMLQRRVDDIERRVNARGG